MVRLVPRGKKCKQWEEQAVCNRLQQVGSVTASLHTSASFAPPSSVEEFT